MKKILKKLLCCVMIFAVAAASAPFFGVDTVIPAAAESETGKSTEGLKGRQYTDNYIYRRYSEYGIAIVKYTGEMGEYFEIPSEIEGYRVERLDESSFSPYGINYVDSDDKDVPNNPSMNNLKEISIPPTVRVISSGAFEKCENLEKVNFSEGLETIWWRAFKDCQKLTSFDFPSTLVDIYSHNFDGTAVTEVLFKKNTYYDWFAVNNDLFSGSQVIKCTVQGDGVRVDKDAFCNSVLREIIFEGTVVLFENGAFDKDDNTVEKLVFKSGMPDGTYEMLINDYGYHAHIDPVDNSVYFDRNAENTDYISGDFAYALNDALQATITRYTGSKTAVTVPEKIDGYTVTEIGGFAFREESENPGVVSVSLPDTVKSIGAYAFYDCEALEEINTPASLETINSYAFCGCTSLKAFDVPEGLTFLGDYTFSRCESLKKIDLPDSIEKICNGVFMGCTAIEKIRMPQHIKTIGISSFEGTKALAEIDLPETLTIIDDRAFHGSGIKSVTLPKSLEYLLEGVFDESGVVSAVIDGKNLLLSWAFRDCPYLETVEIRNGVSEIWGAAFADCPSLKTVTLPENLKEIEPMAFSKCVNLETVYYNAINCEVHTSSINPKNPVFFNCNPENIYIGDKVEYLGAALFMDCETLVSVTLPDSVTTVDRNAFYSCAELTSVEWNAVSKHIGQRAFAGCPKLTGFDFSNIEKSYSNSFKGSGIVKAQLGETKDETPSNLQVIETQAFMECENLETVGIGGNVSTVEAQAFAACTNLETAVISDSVTDIANDAFEGCDKLTIYCTENSYAHSYAQTQGIKVTTFVIAPIPNQPYTGSEIKPEVSVSLSGDTLSKNVDFGVTYANNINVGKADVDVKGKGDFRMYASRANFTIVTNKISNAVIASIPAQNYTGEAVTPSLTVTYGSNILREGVDYTVTYKNNTKEGTATAEIKGIGNYSGTAKATFRIERQSVIQQLISAVSTFINSIFAIIKSIFA